MAEWITDRTQADVDHVNEIHKKAVSGTWTEEEQAEWVSGMKGALNVKDLNRIAKGINELSEVLCIDSSVPIIRYGWNQENVATTIDIFLISVNIDNIRKKCSGKANTPKFKNGDVLSTFSYFNKVEQILSDVEELVKTYVTFSGEYSCGEGQYGF